MSISFSGSTLTFSDSTTMTTASVAGPPGPAGPAGAPSNVAGPPGPTGTPSSTYGAVGSYIIAGMGSDGLYSDGSVVTVAAGTTIAGACLRYTNQNYTCCSNLRALNSAPTYQGGARLATFNDCRGSSLGLTGTWRSVTYTRVYYSNSWAPLALLVRVS
jgi:hypothetical protein